MVDLLRWAERFVATPSVSRDGNHAIARLAAKLLIAHDIEPRLVPAVHDGVEHFTLIADLGPPLREGAEGLLLLTHLDTVPPGNPEDWTETGGNPFCPTRVGDRLYGLGSADAKVDFVCKAAALAGIDRRTLCRPVRIVGTFGEEIGLVGTRTLVAAGETAGLRHALVGEPSELVAIRAHKGYAVFDARIRLDALSDASGQIAHERFEGGAAHSSTPHLGKNAIEAALERLAAPDVRGVSSLDGGAAVNQVLAQCALGVLLGEGNGGAPAGPVWDAQPLVAFHLAWRRLLARLAETRDPEFDPDFTVGNLGRVRLRDGEALLSFDLRPIPGVDPRAAVQPLEELAEIECMRTNPALATAPDAPLVAAVKDAQGALGIDAGVGTKATCTEAGVLSAAGLDVLVLGAGRSVGNVHRPNEHTLIPQLGQARDLYSAVITALCVEGG